MDKTRGTCLIVHMPDLLHHTIHQTVSEIFDLYTQLHGVRISLFSPNGKLVYPDVEGRPDCPYCKMLRNSMGLDSKCRALDRKMMQAALEQQQMISYTCHAGMREAAVPLMMEGQLAGFVMLGQFRSEAAPDLAPYAARWADENHSAALQAAYEQTPVFSEQKIEMLLSMFRYLVELIMSGQMIHRKDYDLVQPVIELIRKTPGRELTLPQAAGMVGRSPSTVTRVFKKVTGRSFKQYQQHCRMVHAAHLLEAKPNSPVSEIARRVGYDDPLYFSRAFSRQHGRSPSAFRKKPAGA